MSLRYSVLNFKYLILSTSVLTAVWLVLVEFDLASVIVGVLFVSLALAIHLRLKKQQSQDVRVDTPLRLAVLPRFILFFIVQSIVGGLDTAKRAFSPALNISPVFVRYKMQFLTIGINSTLFVNLVSLLPGSLIVLQEEDGILVHVLSINGNTQQDIAKCEKIVADLMGVDGNVRQNLTQGSESKDNS